MKSIAFIGPSSIGKSTFLDAFAEQSSDNSTWVTHQAVLRHLQPRPLGLAGRVLRKIGRARNAPDSTRDVNLFRLYNEDISLITEIFLRSILECDSCSWQKIQLSNYYFNSIVGRALRILHEYEYPKIILFDEGIFQVGRITSWNPATDPTTSLTQSRIMPRAIVHFDLEHNAYKARIENRFRENGARRFHKTGKIVEEDMLDEYICQYRKMGSIKLDICRQLDIPVLQLEAEPTSENFQLLEDFIDRLHHESYGEMPA